MKFILAEKKEMTQKYRPNGSVVAVTKLSVNPCTVIQIKSQKNDGYWAVQIGCGAKKKLSKPRLGHLKKLGQFRYLKEFRVDQQQAAALKVGDTLGVDIFQVGDVVQVTGLSKGRGFQGVVKRHGFSGSPASHGHKDQLRRSGSIGSSGVANVFKGSRMAGRMGGSRVTVKNLEVIEVDPKNKEIFVKGAVPGSKGNLTLIAGAGEINKPESAGKEGPAQEKNLPTEEVKPSSPALTPIKGQEALAEGEKTAVAPREEIRAENKEMSQGK